MEEEEEKELHGRAALLDWLRRTLIDWVARQEEGRRSNPSLLCRVEKALAAFPSARSRL